MANLSLPDIDLWYDDRGGTGPSILFLHGLGGQGNDWTPQLDHFGDRYRVIAVDVCGHGRSGKPPGPYSVARFAGQVAELIRRVVGGPVHLVGLSMGGMIAFQLAVDAPELVSTLTIVNSGPELVPRNLTERWALWLRVVTVKWMGLPKMGAVLAPRLFPGVDQETARRVFLERFVANDPAAYLASLRALIGWSVLARIGSIQAPTLVVASLLDYTPPSRKEEYVRLMRRAKMVVVPDTHHALPMEAPDRFNYVLEPFLVESIASASGGR